MVRETMASDVQYRLLLEYNCSRLNTWPKLRILLSVNNDSIFTLLSMNVINYILLHLNVNKCKFICDNFEI